ncbi:MAG: hypothetical protein ACREOM_00185 [Candidatus Dormibacteraceae bacterium]
MTRFMACVVFVAVLAACQTDTQAVASPAPTPTPHAPPTTTMLQSADVPAGLNACLGSGPIDVYLMQLASEDAPVEARVSAQWQQLRAGGAQAGAVSVFAASQLACIAELGTTGTIKAMTSIVAAFGDQGEADRAWESGFFDFAPPPTGQLVTGVTRGTATGLGLSSFTYDRPPVHLACWHRSVFVALVVVSDLDAPTFKSATMAVDARLN